MPCVAFAVSRAARCKRAIISLEFAVIAIAFLFFIVALTETSVLLLTDVVLQFGIREASRFGVTGAAYPPNMAANPPASREAAITAIITGAGLGLINSARLTVTLTSYPAFTGVGGAGGVPGAGGSATVVKYKIVYVQPWVTSLAASLTGTAAFTHNITWIVQNEPF